MNWTNVCVMASCRGDGGVERDMKWGELDGEGYACSVDGDANHR